MLQRVLRSWVPLDIPLGHPRCPDPGALSHVQRPEFRQTWLPLLTTKDRITTALNDWAYVREQRVFLEQRVLLRLPPDDTPIEPASLFTITRLLEHDSVRNRIHAGALARMVDPSAHPSQAVNLLSVSLYWTHQHDDAAPFLRTAHPHHPRNSPINIHVAFFQLMVGRNAEALPYYAVAARQRGSVPRLRARSRKAGVRWRDTRHVLAPGAAAPVAVALSSPVWPRNGR